MGERREFLAPYHTMTMKPIDDSLGTPPLADAIDRQPLIVTPDTELLDVVTLMHGTASHHYLENSPQLSDSLYGARSSCVLVMQDDELLGIFTERDLVQFTASGNDLRSTKIWEVMHHPVLTMPERSLHNVFAAIFLFRRHRIRHLAITDDQQQLVGVVSLDSIRHILRPTNLLKIRRVAEVMSNQVVTAFPGTTIFELTELMATHQISCIVIIEELPAESEDDSVLNPIGIVTERDIVRFQALELDIYSTQAHSVMSTPLFVLSPEDSLWTAHQAMEQRQVRRLVVSWNWGKKLAIVTQTSILRVFDPIEMHDVIETLQRTIQQLGLDLDKVLASAIDHDTHLPMTPHIHEQSGTPDLKTFLNTLQNQIHHLITHPELPPDARQAALSKVLSDLQQFQGFLQE